MLLELKPMESILRQGNKIHFTSLGCARNLVDTEVMLGLVLKAGYELTQDEAEADFLVINTCGFLESARQEALDILDEFFEVKKESAKVVVTGCMVQKHSNTLKEELPGIHYLLGPGDLENILKALESDDQGEAITSARSFLQWGQIPRQISTPKQYAYLKIAEGCAKRCSFCIIPTIKGPLKSKTEEQVLREFQALLNQGIFEIILIAQDLGDYGKERREKGALERLLREMLKIKGDYWIRLLYLYPDEITDELITVIQSDDRLLPYLDMPLQHINSTILKSMRRKTNREHIIETYEKLRARLPDSIIRTSLMVGYPGETEEQFEELVDFVTQYPLDNVGVFTFSPETGAKASRLENQVPEDVKHERYERLMEAQLKVIGERNRRFIGKQLEVMVEGYHPESEYLMQGRYFGQCPDIDGTVIINDGRAVTSFGQRYQVEITDAIEYDLIGRAIEPVAPPQKVSPLLVLNG